MHPLGPSFYRDFVYQLGSALNDSRWLYLFE
jgi:hypothetical protein